MTPETSLSPNPGHENPYQSPETLDPSPESSAHEPYQPLEGQAKTVGGWLLGYVASALVLVVAQVALLYSDDSASTAGGESRETLYLLGILAAALINLVTFVLFARFLYRANLNARALGNHVVHFSPASMVWWYFVPFANLVQPFRAFRDVYEASFPKGAYASLPAYAELWWGAWVVFLVTERVSSRLPVEYRQTLEIMLGLSAVSAVLAAVLARRMLTALAQRQQRTADGATS